MKHFKILEVDGDEICLVHYLNDAGDSCVEISTWTDSLGEDTQYENEHITFPNEPMALSFIQDYNERSAKEYLNHLKK